MEFLIDFLCSITLIKKCMPPLRPSVAFVFNWYLIVLKKVALWHHREHDRRFPVLQLSGADLLIAFLASAQPYHLAKSTTNDPL